MTSGKQMGGLKHKETAAGVRTCAKEALLLRPVSLRHQSKGKTSLHYTIIRVLGQA